MNPAANHAGVGPSVDFSDGTASHAADPAMVHEWLRSGEAVIVDVRESDEHARERIGGAHSIPLSKFDSARAASLAKSGQRIVFHCKSGMRGADACRMAASAGVDALNMTGGIEAWKRAGLPVQLDTSVSGISVMRQVQMTIGVGVLVGSVLTWFAHPGFIVVPAFFGGGLLFAGASGTCAMATLIGKMPWNRTKPGCGACATPK